MQVECDLESNAQTRADRRQVTAVLTAEWMLWQCVPCFLFGLCVQIGFLLRAFVADDRRSYFLTYLFTALGPTSAP